MSADVEVWTPQYESWRHGGWYVTNVQYPSGAVGCVSRNYEDRKWRIVCDPREGSFYGGSNDHTYASRDDAARAERSIALRLCAAAPKCPSCNAPYGGHGCSRYGCELSRPAVEWDRIWGLFATMAGVRMSRSDALCLPNTEKTLNGRCVGQLFYDDRYGTCLRFIWHDPEECEHRADHGPGCDGPYNCTCGPLTK